jgi:GNAT superfamily N-acetyltransferase
MPAMTVRRVRRGEGASIRELRLRALADAPYAFGSSFVEESEYPPERWDVLAAQSASAETAVVIVAIGDQAAWLGMAGCYVGEHDVTMASVWGMWVDGAVRRRGLGRRLLENVVEWAHSRGVVRLELSVSDRAPGAAALYGTLGFAPTGEQRPLRSDASITEIVMARQPLAVRMADSLP